MVMVMHVAAVTLKVLLNCGVVRLRCREISGLQVLRELVEGVRERTAILRGRIRVRLRSILLQRGEIRLRGGKISGLQILAELLKLLLKLLPRVLYVLRLRSEDIAHETAEDA